MRAEIASGLSFREDVRPSDAAAVREMVRATGFFSDDEVLIAGELVDETLEKGAASGYQFIFAELDGGLAGYTCFGRIPGTASSFDLYWIAVSPGLMRKGLGRELVKRTEYAVASQGGTRIYVDTSSRAGYEPTRKFYESCGYVKEAELADFYSDGDSKCIYVKRPARL